MSRTEIRITGYGGQGVVLSGYIIGRAASINSDLHATMIQSFGPEARGSACSTTLVVSPDEVLYPYIQQPDFFVCMSSEGYSKFGDTIKKGGKLIYNSNLVKPPAAVAKKSYGVPSTELAEKIGRVIVQNIVMIGFFAAATKIVPQEAMRKAVEQSVPGGTEALNLSAFDAGWDYFEENYGAKKGKAAKATAQATAG